MQPMMCDAIAFPLSNFGRNECMWVNWAHMQSVPTAKDARSDRGHAVRYQATINISALSSMLGSAASLLPSNWIALSHLGPTAGRRWGFTEESPVFNRKTAEVPETIAHRNFRY